MGQYIFTPPAASYDIPFTLESLSAYVAKGKSKTFRKIGTTLTIRVGLTGQVVVKLYDTTIARIWKDEILISEDINAFGSQATTYWVQKVLSDNNLPGFVAREDFKYAVAGKIFTL